MKKILLYIAGLCFSILSFSQEKEKLPSFAQSIIVSKSGESVKCYNVDVSSADFVYYQISASDSTSLQRMPKKDIMVVQMPDGTIYNPNSPEHSPQTEETSATQSMFPEIDVSSFHGWLLEKGNCVYVAANSDEEWNHWGVERIKYQISKIGYWTVVDKPEQAHFILQYGVCLRGEDRGFIYLRTRKSYEEYPVNIYDIWMYKVSEPESIIFSVVNTAEDKQANYNAIDRAFSTQNWNYWQKIFDNPESLNDKKSKTKRYFLIP